jgi:hypothetical protein
MSKAAGKFGIEGFDYDRAQAYKNLCKEITWIELRIAAFTSASQEPERWGIDSGDLSDD